MACMLFALRLVCPHTHIVLLLHAIAPCRFLGVGQAHGIALEMPIAQLLHVLAMCSFVFEMVCMPPRLVVLAITAAGGVLCHAW